MNSRRQHDHHALRLPPASRDSRRRQVGTIALGDAAIRRFNALLAQIAPNAPSVSADQVVTLARWLGQQPQDRAVAILSERLARAEHLRRMLNDSDWDVGSETRERARMLTRYLQQVDDLIPDDQPLVGHLDDALLVELSWPAFEDETRDYADFCRFRASERPRGSAAERRLAWETACLAEAALLQQRRDVRSRSYAARPRLPDFIRVT
ncbi:MAG TPA: YkvA family protein [Arenimonas sp.]|nr:YkvA family protein [Arenimonas sp.]